MRNPKRLLLALALLVFALDAAAQAPAFRRRGIYGDWLVKADFNGREMRSVLSFSRDAEGGQTGQWISFWGVTDLKDVKYENGQLSFTQVRQNREGQTMTSAFKGTVQEGKLTGTASSDRGELKLEGERARRMPRAVGTWEIKFSMGEREITSAIVISSEKEGELTVTWPSERVEHTISDASFERGRLTFKAQSKMQDRQWESTFEGTIEGDTLSGTIKSERGEIPVQGTRVGAAVIGTWNLEIASEMGNRKQRLRIDPDMSALYGAIAIKKVDFQDNKVSFKTTLEFGERTMELSFQGTVQDTKLTGELTTPRGTQKVTGTKAPRRFRMRRPE